MAEHLTGGAEAREASVDLAARFRWAVVKDGRRGAWLAGEQVRAGPETGEAGGPTTGGPGTRVAPPESDPSGAGDVFDAALIARLLSGTGVPEAATGADAVAREYVAACGAEGTAGPGWRRVARQEPPLLVSACLVGVASAYDGRPRGGSRPRGDAVFHGTTGPAEDFGDACEPAPDERLWLPVCPEQAGGLHTPRRPAEIRGAGGGEGVLDGRAGVFDDRGRDVTDAFLKGARLAVELARATGCLEGVLKDGSPSCGVTRIYDGTFGGRPVPGLGVTAAALARLGVRLGSDLECV
ncbi:MAG: 2-thiouracil desulfurase family protein [Firmicutes bacterium]|nr:2-thiouracil desulfurase family protein [Bacillota bacterium]